MSDSNYADSFENLKSAPQGAAPEPDRMPNLPEPVLAWAKKDFEQRLGFKGGRYTAVNRLAGLLSAIFLTVIFYIIVVYALQQSPKSQFIADMFLKRGYVPYPIVLLFFWSMTILFIKKQKLKFQRKALDLSAVPQQPEFVLNPDTARHVLDRIRELVDDARHFILLNRIDRALSNLQNIGRISDVSEILQTQSDYDQDLQRSSYSLINGFIWAIPVLGFIGTVLGLSAAIGSFGETLQVAEDISLLKNKLGDVTGGLSTAFETTLIALVAALTIQIRMTFLQQQESSFLDECNDYCHAHVVSKLRLTALEN